VLNTYIRTRIVPEILICQSITVVVQIVAHLLLWLRTNTIPSPLPLANPHPFASTYSRNFLHTPLGWRLNPIVSNPITVIINPIAFLSIRLPRIASNPSQIYIAHLKTQTPSISILLHARSLLARIRHPAITCTVLRHTPLPTPNIHTLITAWALPLIAIPCAISPTSNIHTPPACTLHISLTCLA
jgi:hypothetical protein